MIKYSEIEYCKLNVQYIAPKNKFNEIKTKTINNFKKFKIKGFRPGKATPAAIEFQFKKPINEAVASSLFEEGFQDFLFESKIKPLGMPEIKQHHIDSNEFWCEFSVYKKPDFELKQYLFDIPEPHLSFASKEDAAASILEQIRKHHGNLRPFTENEFVEQNDKITIKIDVLNSDLSKNEELSKEGYVYVVGNNLYPNLDDYLLGMNLDEERDFDSVINNVNYKIKVKVFMGLKVDPMPLDDSLAIKLNMESFDKLYEEVLKIAEKNLADERFKGIVKQIVIKLLAANDFEVPEVFIKAEAKRLSKENPDQYLNVARDNIKLSLILDSIRDKEPRTEFSDMEIMSILKENLKKEGRDIKEVNQVLLPQIVAKLKDDATMSWLVNNSNIIKE